MLSKFPFPVKIISVALLTTFLAQDMAWSYPDVLANDDKLAVTGLQNQDALYRLKAALITNLVTNLIEQSNLSDVRLRNIKELIESNSGDSTLEDIELKTIYGSRKGIRELRLCFDKEGLVIRFFNPDYPAVERTPYGYIDITKEVFKAVSHDLSPDRKTHIQRQVLCRIMNEDRRDLMHRRDKKAGKNNGFSTSEMDSAIRDEVIPAGDNKALLRYHMDKVESVNNPGVGEASSPDKPREKPAENADSRRFYKKKSVRIYEEDHKIVMWQQVYTKPDKESKTLVPTYRPRTFRLRWLAGNSLDRQIVKLLDKRDAAALTGENVNRVNNILYYLKTARLKPLHEIITKKNNDFIYRWKSIKDVFDKAEYKVALDNAYGLWQTIKPYLAEPDMEGLETMLWPAINELKKLENHMWAGETEVAKSRARFWLELAGNRLKNSQLLNEFMALFRDEYVRRRRASNSQYLKEDTFIDVFERFIKQKQLILGSPRTKALEILSYLAIFISLEKDNPKKPSERIPNPTFKAINTLRLLVEVDDIETIINIKRLKGRTSTIDKLKELKTKRFIRELNYEERKDLIKAMAKDFGLNDRERFELAKAFAISSENLRKAYPGSALPAKNGLCDSENPDIIHKAQEFPGSPYYSENIDDLALTKAKKDTREERDRYELGRQSLVSSRSASDRGAFQAKAEGVFAAQDSAGPASAQPTVPNKLGLSLEAPPAETATIFPDSPADSSVEKGINPDPIFSFSPIEYNWQTAFTQDMRREIKTLFESTNIIPRSFARLFKKEVGLEDVAVINFAFFKKGGNRAVYTMDFELVNRQKYTIILKVSLDKRVYAHQALSVLVEPIKKKVDIGGIWQLACGRIVVTEVFVKGKTFAQYTKELLEKNLVKSTRQMGKELCDITREVIKASILFWKDTQGLFINDPKKSQFVITERKRLFARKYLVRVVDTGEQTFKVEPEIIITNDGDVTLRGKGGEALTVYDLVEEMDPEKVVALLMNYLEMRQDERLLNENEILRTVGEIDGYDVIRTMFPQFNKDEEYDRGEFKDIILDRKAVLEGVLDALGQRDGIIFMMRALDADTELTEVFLDYLTDILRMNERVRRRHDRAGIDEWQKRLDRLEAAFQSGLFDSVRVVPWVKTRILGNIFFDKNDKLQWVIRRIVNIERFLDGPLQERIERIKAEVAKEALGSEDLDILEKITGIPFNNGGAIPESATPEQADAGRVSPDRMALEGIDADIENTKTLGSSLASFYEYDAEKIIYTIRLDTSRISSNYIELIRKHYAKILSARIGNVEVKVIGNDKLKTLIDVNVEIGGKIQGNGAVDVAGDKSQIASLGRLVGMVNLAISVASLPDEFTDSGIDKYKGFLGIISAQYQLLTGEKLMLPDNPKDISAFIRAMAMSLPPAKSYGVKPQEEFKLMEEKLKIAA